MKYKILICLVFVFVIYSIFVSSVISVDRLISYKDDNIYILIRTSEGRFWETTVSNIQTAIDSLDNHTGTVWIPGNRTFWLTEKITVWENITLNMGGAEFCTAEGVNITVIELKDGSGVINGIIDVSGHNNVDYTTNSSFNVSNACIYLNATSYIDSATIENMQMWSCGINHSSGTPSLDEAFGRGYGIFFHATNDSVPQRISNVTVKYVKFHMFNKSIYILNERNPNTGENGAIISYNSFESCWSNAGSWHYVIDRNDIASQDDCNISYLSFNHLTAQTGRSSYWGGEKVTWEMLHVDGYHHIFENMMFWDYPNEHRGPGPAVNFTADSENLYAWGVAMLCSITSGMEDNGIDNTRFCSYRSRMWVSSYNILN